MSKNFIEVAPHGEQWAVKREGAERALSLHATQAEAVEAGQQQAKADNVELIVKNRLGQIEWRNSYGHDPYPPKG